MLSNSVNPHISVDCAILGFDGLHLNVLLLRRKGDDSEGRFNNLKLPGSLVYADEDLDDAAKRVLGELFSSDSIYFRQFKSLGSPTRTSNPRDIEWMEDAIKMKIGRIVTVGYLSLVRMDDKLKLKSDKVEAFWCPVSEVRDLAFDHNKILEAALLEVRSFVTMDPVLVFNLLPKKFTAVQMRTLFEQIFGQAMDVRNFNKKIERMDYVVALDERETGVAHRAARYYRFDKKKYSKSLGGFNR